MIGRPLIFETPQKLSEAVEKYFAEEKKPTLAGLAYALGINRQTLYNYETRDDFLDIIKRAREKVEATYEQRLVYENNPTGVIFALKNMSWKDKTEQDLKVEGAIILNGIRPKENVPMGANDLIPESVNGNGKDH